MGPVVSLGRSVLVTARPVRVHEFVELVHQGELRGTAHTVRGHLMVVG